MMNRHMVWICSAALLGALACSSATPESESTSEARLKGGGRGGYAAAVAAVIEPNTGGSCSHGICATGAGLLATCDPCATQLCGVDPYCCSTAWDVTCVGEVASVCGVSCVADAGAGDAATSCTHPICTVGVPLSPSCTSCATQLCAVDSYCCTVAWDTTCVGEVTSVCGTTCN